VPSPRITTPEEPMSWTSQKWLVVQVQHISPKLVTREQFLRERKQTHSTTVLPLLVHQSHWLKMRIEPPTPRDRLTLQLVTSPPRNKYLTIIRLHVIDLEEDEEWTCLDEMRGGGGKEFQTTTT
jgi:hypothetical protein